MKKRERGERESKKGERVIKLLHFIISYVALYNLIVIIVFLGKRILKLCSPTF